MRLRVRSVLTGVALAAALAGQGYGEGYSSAGAAVLRGLDKLAGSSVDISLSQGESATLGPLSVTLAECRYPTANPTAEAYAWLTIRDLSRNETVFDGWMVASSPALNAMDHHRYDIWVLRCTTS